MDNDEKKMASESEVLEEKDEVVEVEEVEEVEENANADGDDCEKIEEDSCSTDGCTCQNNRLKILLAVLLCAVAVYFIWKVSLPQNAAEEVPVMLTADFNTAVNEWLKGDAANGFNMLKSHAEQGLPQAQYYTAVALISGRGTEVNIPAGIAWAEKSVDKQPQAFGVICPAYFGVFGNEFSNQAKAFEWSQKAANANLADGCFFLAVCYMNGVGCPQNTEEAFRLLDLAAQSGHPMAITILNNLSSIGPRTAIRL